MNNNLKEKLRSALKAHDNVYSNIPRREMIKMAVDNKEAIISVSGALATWTPIESTGRSPKDTVAVRRKISEHTIDWTSPNNIPIDEETFDMLFDDALNFLKEVPQVHVTDRVVGADTKYALPVKTVTNHALTSLFTDNMFRPVPENIEESVFYGN